MAKLRQDVTFAKAVIRQNAAKSPGLQQEQLAASYRLKKATKKELNFSRSLASMVQDILSEPGVFYLLSFLIKTGSHVIAFSSQDCKTVIVFDPNFGEFTVPDSKVTNFLTDLLNQGYSIDPNKISGLTRWTI